MDRRRVYSDSELHVDRLGLGFVYGELGPEYVSPCCNAVVSVFRDGVVYCSSCWETVDPLLGGIPVPVVGDDDPDDVAERWLREALARIEERRKRRGGSIPPQRRAGEES